MFSLRIRSLDFGLLCGEKALFFYQAEFGKEKREFTEAKHKGRVMVCLSNFKETQKLFFPEYKSNMCYCRTFGKYSKGENWNHVFLYHPEIMIINVSVYFHPDSFLYIKAMTQGSSISVQQGRQNFAKKYIGILEILLTFQDFCQHAGSRSEKEGWWEETGFRFLATWLGFEQGSR